MSTIRVLIADDHAYVLDGLVALLKPRYDVVAAVSDGRRLVEAATTLRPDVIVTDISMPGLNGVEALHLLKAAGVEARIIMLTLHADADLARVLIQSGASGYVVKVLASSELPEAIEQVMQGKIYRSSSLG